MESNDEAQPASGSKYGASAQLGSLFRQNDVCITWLMDRCDVWYPLCDIKSTLGHMMERDLGDSHLVYALGHWFEVACCRGLACEAESIEAMFEMLHETRAMEESVDSFVTAIRIVSFVGRLVDIATKAPPAREDDDCSPGYVQVSTAVSDADWQEVPVHLRNAVSHILNHGGSAYRCRRYMMILLGEIARRLTRRKKRLTRLQNTVRRLIKDSPHGDIGENEDDISTMWNFWNHFEITEIPLGDPSGALSSLVFPHEDLDVRESDAEDTIITYTNHDGTYRCPFCSNAVDFAPYDESFCRLCHVDGSFECLKNSAPGACDSCGCVVCSACLSSMQKSYRS